MGIGASILIGGAVLHFVQLGALAHTPFATLSPWRLVLLLIGAPGFLWALVILFIREPARRLSEAPALASTAVQPIGWLQVVPMFLVVCLASLVDNAVGAWSPSLLTRDFHMDRAQVGMELGLLLTAAFGGGVLLGGWLADRAGAAGGWSGKVLVCLVVSVLILPLAAAINGSQLQVVFLAIPAYFALSGMVTACGFSAILDVVPNRHRGLAMAVSFFLNVAVGGSVGPMAVSQLSEQVFGPAGGLGGPIGLTVAAAYGVAAVAALVAKFTRR